MEIRMNVAMHVRLGDDEKLFSLRDSLCDSFALIDVANLLFIFMCM